MILLDTHAFVWMASAPEKLSSRAVDAIQRNREGLLVSLASCWEIALLHKRGRLWLPVSPERFLEKALTRHGIHEVPFARATILASVALPEVHRDPFDRILIAEALLRGCPIVTCDEVIASYPGVSVVW
jgi:PIN domain nuclease of toxin-antitoxin system